MGKKTEIEEGRKEDKKEKRKCRWEERQKDTDKIVN